MRRLVQTLSAISLAASVGAMLSGCPVWSDDSRDGMGGPPFPTADSGVPNTCTTHNDCPTGYCESNRCVTSVACQTSTQCPSSLSCDSRHICSPGCFTNTDCSRIAAGLVCDTSTHQCAPGGRCTTDAQCAGTPMTPVCLGGSCQARTNQCQFDYQCTGGGQACVDGRCVVGCTSAATCAAGQQCVSGRCAYPTSGGCGTSCPSGQICVTGACLRTCADDAACGSGFMCDNGVCRVDTRPRPFCTRDSDCNAGSVCYNGACRLLCPTPSATPDGACMSVDVQFNLCRQDAMGRALCTNTNEQMPQCARTTDCSAGHMCVNARCQ